MKKFFLLLFGLIFVFTLNSNAARKKRKSVILYFSANQDWMEKIANAYEDKTKKEGDPVIVKALRLSTGEVSARLKAEKRRPKADVWMGGTFGPHGEAYNQGLIESYRPINFNDLSPNLRDPLGGNAVTGLYVGALGWTINEELLKEKNIPIPQTWDDLAKPDYRLKNGKGLIGMANPATSGTAYTVMSTLVQLMTDKELEKHKSLYQNLKGNNKTIYQEQQSIQKDIQNLELQIKSQRPGKTQNQLKKQLNELKNTQRVIAKVIRNGEENAFEYMKKLHKNMGQYTKSGRASGPLAGRGELAIAIIFTHDGIQYVQEGYKNLVVLTPKDGTGYEIGGLSLIKNGPNSEEAKKFIDWVLTPEAQELAAQAKSYQIPSNTKAKVPKEAIQLSQVELINYDFKWSSKNRKRLVKKWIKEVKNSSR